jgi:hypothetical protein
VTDEQAEDPTSRAATSGPEPDESPKQRVDRELIELLNGLRVILPGVQVLLAFLLTVPFSARFPEASSVDQGLYFVTVLLTVAATGAFTMPAAFHRIRFRQGDKERMLRIANVFAIAGLVFLTFAMACVVFLITDVIYGLAAALPVALLTLALLGFSWFAVPLIWKGDEDD